MGKCLCGQRTVLAGGRNAEDNISFSACSDDDDNKIDPNQIAGTWQITLIEGWSVDNDGTRDEWSDSYPAIDDDDYYWTYTFDGHGKMKRVSYTDRGVDRSTNGTYTISDNVLTIVENIENNDYQKTQEYQIKELTSSQLILFEHRIDPEFTEEDTYTYKRVN
ncbi:lipocalin family protein [Alistipes sp.]|uniref:lipocalin family protein n=1 Tax=Alistipes sp. TaxID=1872444 RepID=UPI003AB5CFFE